MNGKIKVLSLCLALLVSNRAKAAGDIFCEAGYYSKTYLIIDQSVSYPRDIEEKVNIAIVSASGSEVFKTEKLEWISAGTSSESAHVALVNQQAAGHLTVGYTSHQSKFPANCLRCSEGGFAPTWTAVLTLNGVQTLFSCKTPVF